MMAQTLTIETHFRGERYERASVGLRALADAVGTDFDQLGLVVSREMRLFLKTERDKLAKHHSGSATTSNRLAKRTGELVRALQKGGRVTETPTLADVKGEVFLPSKYRIHEFGGSIRPQKGGYVFVPLPAALKSDGTPKHMNPRQWHGTFIAESKKGNLLLFQRQGPKLIPLYALKPRVSVKRRLGLGAGIRRGVPAFADRAFEALLNEILNES
ncbi:hypothetical protein [Tateyamaria sp.]|uniref:hypothetical protein n=1 Tax=Tateyamaria sp. TaxID=1929288 RepID=UPI003B217D56